jgi:hypothetical protein
MLPKIPQLRQVTAGAISLDGHSADDRRLAQSLATDRRTRRGSRLGRGSCVESRRWYALSWIGRLSGPFSVSGWLRARSRARPRGRRRFGLWPHPTEKTRHAHHRPHTRSLAHTAQVGGWKARFEERGHEVLAQAWPRMDGRGRGHPTRPVRPERARPRPGRGRGSPYRRSW